MELEWRTPSRADDGVWLELLHQLDEADGRGERYALRDLDDEWASAWASPATDASFVWHGPALVAFGWLKVQPRAAGRHRIAAWGGVHPGWRGRGVGGALLDAQLARATEVAATLDPELRTDLEVEALDSQPSLRRLVSSRRFVARGRLLELARPLGGDAPPVEPVPVPSGLELRPWCADLDEPTRLAHNEAFRGQEGGEPHPPHLWRQWLTGHRSFCPDLTRVVVDGDGVVGYVLSATYPQDWERGPREVWLTTIGTRPEARGRGVARAAIAAVLDAGRDVGFERAILGVDAGNRTGAVELYRSLDFVDVRASTTYARRLEVGALSR